MKRKQGGDTVGFAHIYLAKQVKEFKTDDQIDAKLYTPNWTLNLVHLLRNSYFGVFLIRSDWIL